MSDEFETDDERGMDAAVERARERKEPSIGHIDEAVKMLSPEEKAPEEKAPEKPAFGPVEPPPPEPPSVAPPPEAPPEQSFKPADFPSPQPAVQTSAPPDAKAMRLSALDRIRQLADFNPLQPPPPGTSDADVAAAQQRDRAEVRRNNFTKAIDSWMGKTPFNPDAAPEAPGLLARRQAADAEQAKQLTAQEKLVAALKGDKDPGALSEFQKYEMDRNARQDTDKAKAAKDKSDAETQQLNEDRQNFGKELTALGLNPATASQKDVDRAIQMKNANANQALAAAQFGDKKKQEDLRQTEGLPANMEIAQGANPAPEQLKDLGTVDRGAEEVHKLANRMREVINGSNRVERVMSPSTRAQLEQLQAEMTLAVKDAGKLGQISAGDQALIDSIRPNATGFESLIRNPASFDAQLKGMERLADDKRATAMKSMGVHLKSAGSNDGSGKSGKVRVTNGKETLLIDAADLDAAAKDGYRQVTR